MGYRDDLFKVQCELKLIRDNSTDEEARIRAMDALNALGQFKKQYELFRMFVDKFNEYLKYF